MNTAATLKPGSLGDSKLSNPTDDLTAGATSTARSLNGSKISAVTESASGTASSLRSIVEGRFMRMSEAHDRIRTQLLARYPRPAS